MSVTSGWGRFTWGQAEWNEDVTLSHGLGCSINGAAMAAGEIFLIKQFQPTSLTGIHLHYNPSVTISGDALVDSS